MYESQTKQNKFDEVTSSKIVNMKGRGAPPPRNPQTQKKKLAKKLAQKMAHDQYQLNLVRGSKNGEEHFHEPFLCSFSQLRQQSDEYYMQSVTP